MMSSRLVRASHLLVMICFLVAPSIISQTWAPQGTSASSHFSDVTFLNDQLGYASGAYGTIIKTTDGGAHWVTQSSGTGLHFSDQCFISATVGWVVGQNGVIVKTTDGGSTWTQQSSNTSSWLNCVQFSDPVTGWAGGENGTIVRTTNGGTSWTSLQCGTSATIESGCFLSGSIGFVACQNGMVLKTQDGGTNWSMMLSSSSALNSISFCNQSVGWAVGGGGKILKSTDAGATWAEQTSGTFQNLNAVSFAGTDSGWVAGDGGAILATTNGGATWSSQISGTTQNLRAVFFLNGHHGYAVGLNNTIIEYAVVHSLPVQLASFTATVVSNHAVRLDWRTISEVNNYGFEVERAIGSPNTFDVVAGSFVGGHGTTNEPRNYLFTDNNTATGRLYYRLKQMDLDGAIHYSDPLAVDVLTSVAATSLPAEFALKQNYPNPFNPSTKIEFSIARTGYVSLKVYDILGREVATLVNDQLSQGSYAKTFLADGLSSGVYWYKLTSGNFSETRKFILSK